MKTLYCITGSLSSIEELRTERGGCEILRTLNPHCSTGSLSSIEELRTERGGCEILQILNPHDTRLKMMLKV